MKIINKSIEVLCLTDEDGTIHPLKFKILKKDGEKQVYEVLRVVETEGLKLGGIKTKDYTCEIEVNDEKKICVLRYDLDSCKWSLYQI